MNQNRPQQKPIKGPFFGILPLLFLLLIISACGQGGGGNSGGTSGVAFRINWDRPVTQIQPLDLSDCQEIVTVSAGVYDEAGTLLQSGGPWDCSSGRGIVAGVPSGSRASAVVFGNDNQGRPLFRGESTDLFDLIPGQTVNAGTIVAGSIVPLLTAPLDGANVLFRSLAFTWSDLPDTEGYRIQISENSDFTTFAVNDTTTAPSYTPQQGALQSGVTYYWRVLGFGFDGVESAPSLTRSFIPSALGIEVSITTPQNGATLDANANLSFAATVTDELGRDVTAFNSVLWSSDRDGSIGETLDFTGNLRSPGTHVITLTAEDERGYASADQITVTVGRLVVNITSPKDSESRLSGLGIDFTGTFSYEGVTGGTPNLSWSTNLEGPIGSGTSFTGDLTEPGTHVVSLMAMDSDIGLRSSASIQFQVTNTRPVIVLGAPSAGSAHEISIANYDGIYFYASATDAEDGEFMPAPQYPWTWTLYRDAAMTDMVYSWTGWEYGYVGGIQGGVPLDANGNTDWVIGDYWMKVTVEDSYRALATQVVNFSVTFTP